MSDINLLDDILARMLAGELSELEVEQAGVRIAMRLSTEGETGTAVTPISVTTRAIGTFHATHPRRLGERLTPGDTVAEGAILGYLAVDPTLTSIIAPAAGKITAIIARDGQLLGYGAPAFTMDKVV